jgi:HEAT repeat protein
MSYFSGERDMAQGKGRKIAILAAAVAGGVIIVAVWAFHPLIVEEIAVRRETAKLSSEDGDERRAAAERLAQMESPRALAALLEAAEDPEVYDGLSMWMLLEDGRGARWRSPLPVLVEFLRRGKGNGDLRFWAARKALAIDPRSPAAIDALLVLVRGGCGESFDLLEAVGADPVPALIALLGDATSENRSWAAGRLGEIGPQASAALPALYAALQDPEPEIRKAVLECLPEVEEREKAVRSLKEALADPDEYVRSRAKDGLEDLGVTRSEYLPLLKPDDFFFGEDSDWVPMYVRCLKKNDPAGKVEALQRLRELGPAALASAPAVREAFADPDPIISRLALRTLVALEDREGLEALLPALAALVESNPRAFRREPVHVAQVLKEKAAPLVPHLVKALASDDVDLRRDAAMALGLVGQAARDAVPALSVGLRDPDEKVAASSAFALLKMGSVALPALPWLEDARLSRKVVLSVWAAGATIAIDPSRKAELLPAIVRRLDDETVQAAKVLRNLRGLGREAAPALVARILKPVKEDPFDDLWLDREEEPIWKNVVGALDQVGFGDPEIPILLKALEDGDERVRRRAINVLSEFGVRASSPAALIAPLSEALRRDREAIGRAFAAGTIGALGPAAAPAVPSLIEALGDRDRDVREAAAEALGKIGPAARAAVPALEEAALGRKKAVRHAAREALEEILAAR